MHCAVRTWISGERKKEGGRRGGIIDGSSICGKRGTTTTTIYEKGKKDTFSPTFVSRGRHATCTSDTVSSRLLPRKQSIFKLPFVYSIDNVRVPAQFNLTLKPCSPPLFSVSPYPCGVLYPQIRTSRSFPFSLIHFVRCSIQSQFNATCWTGSDGKGSRLKVAYFGLL